MLINPNGVLFGAGSRVDVAGLIATTANLSDQDFKAGRLNFALPSNSPTASVVNRGTISVAEGGLVALVAPGVANQGVINARLGRVSLVSADRFTVDFHGDQLIQFALDDKVARTVVAPDGMALSAAVANTGRIVANGGTVQMSANVASGVLDHVIDMTGIVEARAVSKIGGTIVLDGGAAGTVAVSGKLDVSGKRAGQTGGTVEILGQQVGLFAGTRVDASGQAGGGTVLVGGNQHGQGPQRTAQATYVDKDATITADATRSGNGGTVVVWSDRYTNFAGTISARGGPQGGNGGQVETSSHIVLSTSGQVSAAAPAGKPGQWLLDPAAANVDINNGVANSGFNMASPDVFTPPGNNSIADVGTIVAALNGGTDVVINTAGAGNQPGTLTVSQPISKTAGGAASLTLNASSDYTQNATISSTSNALNVTVNAGGGYTSNQATLTNGGNFSVTAGGSYAQNGIVTTGAGSVTVNAGGSYAGNNTITTTNAAVSITAGGSYSASGTVTTNGANFQIQAGGAVDMGTTSTGAGNITVTGSGDITQSNGPLQQTTGSASFTAGPGKITLTNGGNALGPVTLSNSGAHDVSVTNNGDLHIASAAVGSGALTLKSLSGGVSQTGTIVQAALAGTATITANTNINLSNGNNLFTGAVSLNNIGNNNITFDNNAAVVLAASTMGNGTLSISAVGDITQTGALIQGNASPGSLIFDAPGGQIALTNAANQLSGDLFLTNTGNHPVSVTSATLSINTSNITGSLTLTADQLLTPGTVTNTGGTLTVTPLTASTNVRFGGGPGGGALVFTDAARTTKYVGFTNYVIGSTTGIGAVTLGAAEALGAASLTLQAGGASGNVNMLGNSVTLTGAGALTLNAGNNLTTAAITLAGGVLNATAGTNITVSAPITTTGGAINLTGPITLPGATVLNTGGGAINLAGAVSGGGQTLTMNAGTTGDISLQSVGSAGAPLAAITIQNAHNVTASGLVATNALTQTAGTGTTNFAGAGVSSTGAVSLTTNAIAGIFNVGSFTVTSAQTIVTGSIAGTSGVGAAALASATGSTGTQTFNGCTIGTSCVAPSPPPPSSPPPSGGSGVTTTQTSNATTVARQIIGATNQSSSDGSDQSNVRGFEVTIPMQNIDWSDPAGDLRIRLAPDYQVLSRFFYAGEASNRQLYGGRSSR
jgi:hypothetical protein